jgi:hypothetical protein
LRSKGLFCKEPTLAMTDRQIYFLRPTFIVLIAGVALGGLAQVVWPPREDRVEFVGPGGPTADQLESMDLHRVALPRPELSPAEVVRLQLDGLSDATPDGVGIVQCFAFASPGNRLVTGPLERFGKMVRKPPFDCLGRSQAVLIGRPQFEHGVARILVTVVDESSQVRAFSFILAKQKSVPVAGCWMTDAVLPAAPWLDPEKVEEAVGGDSAI